MNWHSLYKSIHFILLGGLFVAFTQLASAQTESDSTAYFDELPRPRIELSTGVMSYFGDVGNLDGISQSSTLNWGYKLSLRNPISDSFDLDLFALFGSLSANERLIDNDADFRTSISMGGLSLRYNFNALLPEQRQITPYLSVGVTTFEFNPKADRLDANGVPYNYWSDGSIRSLPQNAPNAGEAGILTRDREYETDLRLTNEEGIESYSIRSFSIPIGAGAEIVASPSFSIRLGAEYHFGFTDNLDNISNPETGRKGNDHFLFSNVGVVYNLRYKKDKKANAVGLDPELLAGEFDDQDGDNVADIVDLCPNTPSEVAVNEFGCPLDGDKDGVPDYLDLEPNTPAGVAVNLNGEALTDEAIEKMYALYKDSLGIQNFTKTQTFTADVDRNNLVVGNRKKGYRVVIDTEGGSINSSDIGKLLSIAEIKFEEKDGSTSYYLGEFTNLEETVSKKLSLDEMGISSRIVYNEFGNLTDVNAAEVNAIAQSVDAGGINAEGTVFRVQIGAYRYKLSGDAFKDVSNLLIIEGDDGLTRYVSGSFPTIKEAAEHKVNLLLKGFEGAFVTAYRDGKRITLKEAGAQVNTTENINTVKTGGAINKKFVKFAVQVDSFSGRVPAETLAKFMELGNVRPIRSEGSGTKYIYGNYSSFEEAESVLSELKERGFEKAFVVGEFNGKIISAEEAQRIKEE
jgi:hypothetical protein